MNFVSYVSFFLIGLNFNFKEEQIIFNKFKRTNYTLYYNYKILFISTYRVGLRLLYLKNYTITIGLDGYAISNSPTIDPWLWEWLQELMRNNSSQLLQLDKPLMWSPSSLLKQNFPQSNGQPDLASRTQRKTKCYVCVL